MDLIHEANKLAANLSHDFNKLIFEDSSKNSERRPIVAYSGEFQPFHKMHYEIYNRLVDKFGKENVYVVTGENADEPTQPMSFVDKEYVITELFNIDEDHIEQVENPFIPKELLKKFNPKTTSFIAVVSNTDAEQLEKSEYFKKYDDDIALKSYREEGYFLSEPEVGISIGNQTLTDSQLTQVLTSADTPDEVKDKILRTIYPTENKAVFDLIKNKMSGSDQRASKKTSISNKGGSSTDLKKTDVSDKKSDAPEVSGSNSTPIMQRKIKNPLTGKDIKIQSALKYPRWKPVYKMANQVLKAAGIDRKDRTKEPEVNARYKARAKRLNTEILTQELSNQITEEILHQATTGSGIKLYVEGIGNIFLVLEGGHAVVNNSKIPNKMAQPTVANIVNRLGISQLEHELVGTTEKPIMNDLDVAVDIADVKQLIGYSGDDKKEFFSKLKDFLGNDSGITISPGFSQFSISAPLINDRGEHESSVNQDGTQGTDKGNVQVDFMIGHLPWMRKFLRNGDKSKYSSTYRNILFADILSNIRTDDGNGVQSKYQFDTKYGISKVQFKESPTGKKEILNKEFVSDNVDDLAKIIFGDKSSTFDDVNTFEKLYSSIKSDKFPHRDKVTSIIQTFKKSLENNKKSSPDELSSTNNLYLDDVRPTPDGFNLRAYTAQEAIELLKKGNISSISFDHDLGPEEAGTGYDVAKWIEEEAYTNPNFSTPEWQIHSANPVGIKNIKNAMESADRAPKQSKSPVAIYAGRFQPYHAGHQHAYEDLVKKFGKDNVYIATSDKVDGLKSPFNFDDKKTIMTQMFGIDPDKIVKCNNLYQAKEITDKLPPNTPVVWGLGEKDAERLNNGKYFQKYTDGDPLDSGFEQKGYVYTVPQLPMSINGQTISGTVVRDIFKSGSPEEKKSLFQKLYGKVDNSILDMMSSRVSAGVAASDATDQSKLEKQKQKEKSAAAAKFLKDKIQNPKTKTDILVGTALKYDASHPAHVVAKKYLKSKGVVMESLLLTEAAPRSHVMHPYDDPDMKFGELKDIIHQSLLGDFGSEATEKYDGQTLLFTVRDGKVLFARNTQHTKNNGERAMTADQYQEYFSGHGDKISGIFSDAAREVTAAVSKIPQDKLEATFGNGKNYVLSELLSAELPNTLPYGTNRIVMLNIREYDSATGNPTDAPIDRFAADTLVKDINQYANGQSGKFKISGNTKLQFDNSKSAEYKKKEQEYFSTIDSLQKETNLTDDSTIGQYFSKKWSDILNSSSVQWSAEERQSLIRRWVYGDKSFGVKHLDSPEKKSAFSAIESNQKKYVSQMVSPIKTVILKSGIDAVNRATNIVSKNDGTKDRLKQTFKKSLDAIRKSKNPEFIQKAKDEVDQLAKLGDDALIPSEGLIFQRNGKLYKMTGSFTPVNQIVGIYTYKLNPTNAKDIPKSDAPDSKKQKTKSSTPSDKDNTKSGDVDVSHYPPEILNKTVHNPETKHDILVKTALGYEKSHPSYKAAKLLLKQKGGV